MNSLARSSAGYLTSRLLWRPLLNQVTSLPKPMKLSSPRSFHAYSSPLFTAGDHCQVDINFGHANVRIQKPAPEFTTDALVDGNFKKISLKDFKGKYVVLFFYPLDFTFVCPTEIIAFNDSAEKFAELNCEVLACSVDSKFSHLAWVNTPRKQGGLGPMRIPILSDLNKQISRDYGVLLEKEGLALRGLFIIDDKGILRQITMNDLPVGRSVEETLRLVKAFQFVDKHGEVCPANWKPGDKTIVPNATDSKAYFSSVRNKKISPTERQ